MTRNSQYAQELTYDDAEKIEGSLISMTDPPRGSLTSEHSSRFLIALLGTTPELKALSIPKEESFSPVGPFPRISSKIFRRYGKKIASPVSQKGVSVCEARVTASSIKRLETNTLEYEINNSIPFRAMASRIALFKSLTPMMPWKVLVRYFTSPSGPIYPRASAAHGETYSTSVFGVSPYF